MKIKVLATFPLFGSMKRPLCTNLALAPDGVVGFGIKAYPDIPLNEFGKAAPFQFFCVDVSTGRVTHSGLRPIPPGTLFALNLCYVGSHHAWLLGINGSEIWFYMLATQQDRLESTRYVFDKEVVPVGDAFLSARWLKQSSLFLVLIRTNYDEVSSDTVYVVRWEYSSPSSQMVLHIDTCDYSKAYVNDDGVLFLLCQRTSAPDKDKDDERSGDLPAWKIKLLALTLEGSVVREDSIPGLGFPIKNQRFPNDDFIEGLDLQIRVIAGPGQRQETCIAALRFQDGTLPNEDLTTIQGGLYWISIQGEILQTAFSASRIESMCVCGNKVIGTDVWQGEQRLWYWPFSTSSEVFVCDYFPSRILHVRVVAMERDPQRFWCIEEYGDAIRISQRDSQYFTEYASVLCQGVSFPTTRDLPYSSDSEHPVALAYQDGLILLVVNQSQKLQLLHIQ